MEPRENTAGIEPADGIVRSYFYFCQTTAPLSGLISKLPAFTEDGFAITAAEPWFKVKVQIIERYLLSFVAGLAGRADEFVFVNLCAGSGLYAIGNKKEIIPGASLIALGVDLPISKWILCVPEAENARALKVRVNRYYRGRNVVIVDGPQNQLMDKLRFFIPPSRRGHKVATFCIVDPFSLEVPFATIESLAMLGCSFLITYTFQMNTRFNHRSYTKEHRDKLVGFLGGPLTADVLKPGFTNNLPFYKRLVKTHANRMLTLGLSASLAAHKLESSLMQVPVYYTGFYSAMLPAREMHREVDAIGHVQYALFP